MTTFVKIRGSSKKQRRTEHIHARTAERERKREGEGRVPDAADASLENR